MIAQILNFLGMFSVQTVGVRPAYIDATRHAWQRGCGAATVSGSRERYHSLKNSGHRKSEEAHEDGYRPTEGEIWSSLCEESWPQKYTRARSLGCFVSGAIHTHAWAVTQEDLPILRRRERRGISPDGLGKSSAKRQGNKARLVWLVCDVHSFSKVFQSFLIFLIVLDSC